MTRLFLDRSSLLKATKKSSTSVWDYVNFHSATFTNPNYNPQSDVIIPDTTVCHLHVWTKLYANKLQ